MTCERFRTWKRELKVVSNILLKKFLGIGYTEIIAPLKYYCFMYLLKQAIKEK